MLSLHLGSHFFCTFLRNRSRSWVDWIEVDQF